jgi:hypothetical protein
MANLLERLSSSTKSEASLLLQKMAYQRFKVNPLAWTRLPSNRYCPRTWLKPQLEGFRRQPRVKLFGMIGANRMGKSVWGAAVTVQTALDLDPLTWADLPTKVEEIKLGEAPKLIWAITTTWDKSRMNQQRHLWDMVPRGLWHGRQSQWKPTTGFYNNVASFKNGSIVKFKSAEQNLSEFESEAVDLVWIDETIPMEYVRAVLARTIDKSGKIIWTTIPDAAELYEVFVEKRFDPESDEMLNQEDVDFVGGVIYDNIFLPKKEIEIARRLWSPQEAQMRALGQFVLREGLVYDEFREDVHVEIPPSPIPPTWTKYESIDPGITNPTAVAFAAVDEDGVVHIYDEIYQRKRTPTEIAMMIYLKRWFHLNYIEESDAGEILDLLERADDEPLDRLQWREKELIRKVKPLLSRYGPCPPTETYIDPAARNTQAGSMMGIHAMYEGVGIWATLAQNDKTAGINRVKQHLRGLGGSPMLRVGVACRWARYEFTHYRYVKADPKLPRSQFLGDRERPRDVDDHLMDAIYYLLLQRPGWTPGSVPAPQPHTVAGRHAELVRERLAAKVRRGHRRPLVQVALD